MKGFDLPSTKRADAAWDDVPPDAALRADLYEGLLVRRTFGYLVDLLLIGLVYAIAYVFALLIGIFTLGIAWPLVAGLLPLVPALYVTLTVGAEAAATPGMRLMDVEIRAFDGTKPGYARAFLLAAFFYLSFILTSGIVLIVGLFNDRRRLLHDVLAGALAVRASRVGEPPAPPA
ncbi:MAG: RDD family protein [Rhodovibrionaceae bacterium]|nr:RDD family protein [Rhodovibrionaceae bacterium]